MESQTGHFSRPTAAWLVSNLVSNEIDEVLTTELASSRLRAGISLSRMKDAGVELLPLNLQKAGQVPGVLFVGKYVPDSGANRFYQDGGTRGPAWISDIQRVKAAGARIVVDYTDHHLVSQDARGPFYRTIFPLVDIAVVPSQKMASNLTQVWPGPSVIIPEPIEVPITTPSAKSVGPSRKAVALWFGHNSNLPYLYEFIARASGKLPPMDYVILTNGIDPADLKRAASAGHPKSRFHVAKWSVQATIEAARQCDLALIPSDASDPRKNGVSNGRLLTALALGLPVAAEPLESYLPFRDYFVDIRSPALTDLIANPSAFHPQVLKAQAEVLPAYTADAVGKMWLKLLEPQV